VVIQLKNSDSRVAIEPARGGMVTAFDVGGRPVLFLDGATLADPSKNVRGGIPVLFPSPGKLRDDHWARGRLAQHGFARNLPWEVVSAAATVARLRLATSGGLWPWGFSYEIDYTLDGHKLRLDLRVANNSDEPMPCGLGFHPYFAVADKAHTQIATPATRAFDNVEKRVVDYALDLTRPEVDLHLLDHGSSASSLTTPEHRIDITCSSEFTRWVIWTLASRDFVCLEPWTCPGDALNTGESLLTVERGKPLSLFVEIAVQTPSSSHSPT
jgi:galactose mutarotase-like enzyme